MELQLVVTPPPQIGSLPKLPQIDQNFLDTGLGSASQRIFPRKTNYSKLWNILLLQFYCLKGIHSILISYYVYCHSGRFCYLFVPRWGKIQLFLSVNNKKICAIS